jgi:hypothetical protein
METQQGGEEVYLLLVHNLDTTGDPFPGAKRGRGVTVNTPPTSAEVKNEQELHLISPLLPAWRVEGHLYFYFTPFHGKVYLKANSLILSGNQLSPSFSRLELCLPLRVAGW